MADEVVTADVSDTGSTPAGGSDAGSPPAAPVGTGTSTPESVAAAGSTPATPAEGADEPEVWKNWLNKYGGDRQAAAEAAWHNNNRNAALTRDYEAAKARIAELERAPKAPPQPQAPPPRLEKLDQRITAVEANKQALISEQQATVGNVRAAQEELAVIKWQLNHADPMDRPGIQQQANAAQRALDQAVAEYKRFGLLISQQDGLIEDLKDRRVGVESELKAEAARQEQAEAESARFQEEFPRTVDGYIEQTAKEILPDIPAAYGSPLWQIVNALTTVDYFLASQQPASQVDAQALIRSHMESIKAFVTEIKRSSFGEHSAATLAVKKPLTPAAPAPAAKPAATTKATPSWQNPANADWRDLPQYRAARGEQP